VVAKAGSREQGRRRTDEEEVRPVYILFLRLFDDLTMMMRSVTNDE
jgi:hypothetical protein